MIISRIEGGLGNQMFQYAIGRILAEINNEELFLDTHGLYIPIEGHLSRDYMLDAFKIKASIASDELLNRIRKGTFLNKLSFKKIKHYKQLVFDEINPKISFIKYSDYYLKPEINTFYPEILKKDNTDIYLDGYWQSYKYFYNYESLIKEHFAIKESVLDFEKSYLENINNSQSVSLHLRLTDRIATEFSLAHYRNLEWDYYVDAINIIKEKVSNPHFFIFSDNIKWCEENIKLDFPVTLVKTKDEFNDMYLMGSCKHHIIAHSTFSWWAVWLKYNSNKIVITPKKWFNRQTDELEDLIPESWIKL